MRRNGIKAFISNEAAAIAPMYAIALFGLVGIAGVGFDYGRLMSMDSELQNAADQAALAAATQLDGREGAMVRARRRAAVSTRSRTSASTFSDAAPRTSRSHSVSMSATPSRSEGARRCVGARIRDPPRAEGPEAAAALRRRIPSRT